MKAPKRIWVDEPDVFIKPVTDDEVEYVRADLVDGLVEALGNLICYAPTEPVECRGDKCRELWCLSCFGEDTVERALEDSKNRINQARDALKELEEE